jgi:hypothetical protein
MNGMGDFNEAVMALLNTGVVSGEFSNDIVKDRRMDNESKSYTMKLDF